MKAHAVVLKIWIAPNKGDPMQSFTKAKALKGAGLEGDRYARAEGSWNQGRPGKRQVSLINFHCFKGTHFQTRDSRRNIITEGGELMILIGKEFQIGTAKFRGTKYCTPCDRPSNLCDKPGFKETFTERGGILAEVLEEGEFAVGDAIFVFDD